MGRAPSRTQAVVVLDAGIVIGVLEAGDAHHAAATDALESHLADELRLPSTAYAEVLVRPARRGRRDEAIADVAALGIAVDPLTAEAAEAAAELRARHPSLRFADALVLGCAAAIDADVVLTTDRSLRRLDRRVRVVR